MEDLAFYLRPTFILDSNDPRVMGKADEIVAGCVTGTAAEKARKLFLFARDGIPFSRFVRVGTPQDFKASTTLARKKGYCGQKAALLAALFRAAGLPSRIGLADIRNHRTVPQMLELLGTNIFKVHAFVEVLVDGVWRKATPAFDSTTCNRVGWPVVQFDGLNDGMLAATTADGRPFIEYIRHFGVFPDYPYDLVMKEMYDFYGQETMARWQAHATDVGDKETVC